MKILHVLSDLSPRTGGPVTAIKALVQKQIQRSHEVVIVSTDYGLETAAVDSGLEAGYLICPCTFGPWRYSHQMREVLATWVAWCDVLHVHTLWEYPTLAAIRMAREMAKPFLLRPCGMLDHWSMSQSRWKKRVYLALFRKTLFAPPSRPRFLKRRDNARRHSLRPGC